MDRTHMEEQQNSSAARYKLLLAALLLFTALLSAKIASRRVLWTDEFFEFYTDHLPSARDVLNTQLHYPISLDPPTFHLVSHLALRLLGSSPVAFRLPSLLGFLLMQTSLFALVRRAAGDRAALVAASFPLFTGAFHYSYEARPYALLLGLDTSALACWFIAYRREARRKLAIAGLAVSLVLAVTSHFFGLIVFLPVGMAEGAATWHRRRVDWGTALTVAASAASVALLLPFRSATEPFRAHYPSTGVSFDSIAATFRDLFVGDFNLQPTGVQYADRILLAGCLALLAVAVLRFRRRSIDQPAPLWAGIAGLALLPAAACLVARFITHTVSSRYSLPTISAFAVLFGIAVAPLLQRDAVNVAVCAVMLALGVGGAWLRLRQVEEEARSQIEMVRTPDSLPRYPQGNLYIQTLSQFLFISYYSPDPWIRAHLVVVYDKSRELRWENFDTFSRTVENMQHFTTLRSEPFCSFIARPDTLFVDFPWSFEWGGKELAADRIVTTSLGPGYSGNLLRVHGQPVCRVSVGNHE
jgi:4-amino-4-deoxy-L-arabinose transferase-like glycosyltransferase